VLVLGHIQRGGTPTARDRIIASLSGASAVEALVNGRSGVMIGIRCGRPVEVALEEVLAHGKPDPDFGMLQLAQALAG
jgi:6-phosphofructokinase 1